MTSVIRLRVEKSGLPPGTVLLEDAASLTLGLHDSLARLIQYRLGYTTRGRLPAEAKDLTAVVLFGVSEGSGVLECRPLDIPSLHGQNPAILAATELVGAINAYAANGVWPRTLPPVVRNRIGVAVASVMKPSASVELSVVHEGAAATCFIDESLQAALQEPETFSESEPLRLVGKIYNIDVKSRRLKIDAITRKVAVPFAKEQLELVDSLRWDKRAYISGIPADPRLKALASALEIREAHGGEEDGVVVPSELFRGEKTEAFLATISRLEQIAQLQPNWDSYRAQPAPPATLNFVRSFVRDVAGVLVDYDIDPPTPFVTPTPIGGIQLEWSVDGRELELEIPMPKRFQFLRVSGGVEEERMATRWEAIRLVRWIATGEEP